MNATTPEYVWLVVAPGKWVRCVQFASFLGAVKVTTYDGKIFAGLRVRRIMGAVLCEPNTI